ATRFDGLGVYVAMPTVNAGDGNVQCLFGQGSFSGAVYKLQVALNECYHQNIATDQDFGPQTKEALRNAQRFEQIADDGFYGPETGAHLMWPIREAGGNRVIACDRFPEFFGR
ncbi:MAG TPA: peptidoglycan-binding domain-containing protein, partial [Candidatus Limnocylindria bacterium]|nr:peptidoglycan-binding domain-containing protein [Candidatus Limnocylindria bacterium]